MDECHSPSALALYLKSGPASRAEVLADTKNWIERQRGERQTRRRKRLSRRERRGKRDSISDCTCSRTTSGLSPIGTEYGRHLGLLAASPTPWNPMVRSGAHPVCSPVKRIISTVAENQNRDPINLQSNAMLLIVKCVNYDYLKKCYKWFCKKSNVKHIKLITCNSLMNQLSIFCYFLITVFFHNKTLFSASFS